MNIMISQSNKHQKGSKSRLTNLYPKEKSFLREISKGKSPTDAAETSYNVKNRKVASQIASTVMRRQRFIDVLERVGLTDNFLAEKLKEGFSSVKPLITKEGVDWYPDDQSRLGYLKTAVRIKGYLNSENDVNTSQNEPLIIRAVQFIGDTQINISNEKNKI